MRKNSYFVLLVLLFTVTTRLMAQTPPPRPMPAPRAPDLSEITPSNVINPLQETFVSLTEGFAINLPKRISGFGNKAYPVENGQTVSVTEYNWQQAKVNFAISSVIPRVDFSKPEIRQISADATRAKSIAGIEKLKGRLISEKALLRFLPGFE